MLQVRHTHSNPDGKGVKGACVGIIPFAGLVRSLIQKDNNGNTCQNKEKQNNPKVLQVIFIMEQQPDNSQDQREKVVGISRRMVEHIVCEFFLVSEPAPVYAPDTAYGPAIEDSAMPLMVVLLADKVPHEIAQVHVSYLVPKKELNIIQVGRDYWGL